MRGEAKVEIFKNAPIPKAVAYLAIPTIISQLIAMLYNLADTFFVGQTGDPNKVAAVSLVFPAYCTLVAVANLFGVGGSSMIARSLGAQRPERARHASAFCVYGAVGVALLYSLTVLALKRPFLKLLGASASIEPFANDYIMWVLVIGGAPTVLSMLFGHLVRAEGGARQASLGMSLGGILNIILDPIFIFPMGLGVAGAAMATMISNVVAVAYFLRYLRRIKGRTVISLRIGDLAMDGQLISSIVSVGFPASLQTLLSTVSNMVLNNLAAAYGAAAVAAVGIVKKIDMIPMNVTSGLSQGILPFIGYNYAAKSYDRVQKANRFARFAAVGFSLLCIAAFELFAERIVALFIGDAETVRLGAAFLRMLCLATPMMAISFLITTMFQAVGRGDRALMISFFRKATVDVPLMFLMNRLVPLYGLLIVQPIVDTLSVGLAFALYGSFMKGLKAQGRSGGVES
jgi:putative MATE family efflux protein